MIDEFIFKEIRRLMREIDRMFGELERGSRINLFENIEEREDGYLIKLPMPGVDKKDIDLRIDDERNLIIVKAKSKSELEKDNIFSMQAYNYYYTLPIPYDANKDAIIAKYDKGMLYIFIPKQPRDKGRKIDIQ